MKLAADRIREHKRRFPHLCQASMVIGAAEVVHAVKSGVMLTRAKTISIGRLLRLLNAQEEAIDAMRPRP